MPLNDADFCLQSQSQSQYEICIASLTVLDGRYRRETALQGGLILVESGRLERGDDTLQTL